MDREWVVHSDGIQDFIKNFQSKTTYVGGRIIFKEHTEESKFWGLLPKLGYVMSDSGQCEIVANKAVVPTNDSVGELIREFKSLAKTHGLRLQAVEGGNIDEQPRWVLASEENYYPWWEE